ncbi:TRAP transporter substrate-binding protein [Halomonas sp.]|uniref:TRAP transporter substrate-binding protein n=1 Tax=Halomonas sp. TaxID=1486246 RepID=UPI003A91EB89
MNLTRRSFLSAVGATAAAVTLPAYVKNAYANTSLIYSDVLPASNFQVQNVVRYAERLKQESGGEIAINVIAGGALGVHSQDAMYAVQSGMVQMAGLNLSAQVGEIPLLGSEGIPFLVEDYQQLSDFHQYFRPEVERIMGDNQQKCLFLSPSPPQYLFLNKLVETHDDLYGVPIRGADKFTVDICNAIGMSGVIIPWGETIPALATGRVDGVATSAASANDGQFWELLKYFYPTNHTWASNAVTINMSSWERLSEAQRTLMADLAIDMEPDFWRASQEADANSLETLQQHGMEQVAISGALMNEMRESCFPLRASFYKRAPQAEELVQQYLSDMGQA